MAATRGPLRPTLRGSKVRCCCLQNSECACLSVATPSATRPRRMSSNSFRDSAAGRSRQGLGSRASLWAR